MINIKPLLLAVVGLATPAIASASTGNGGYITNFFTGDSGRVVFSQNGPRSAVPSCSADTIRWSFDSTTAGGQAELAILLTAKAQHQQVFVAGTDACSPATPDVETMFFFYTIPD